MFKVWCALHDTQTLAWDWYVQQVTLPFFFLSFFLSFFLCFYLISKLNTFVLFFKSVKKYFLFEIVLVSIYSILMKLSFIHFCIQSFSISKYLLLCRISVFYPFLFNSQSFAKTDPLKLNPLFCVWSLVTSNEWMIFFSKSDLFFFNHHFQETKKWETHFFKVF